MTERISFEGTEDGEHGVTTTTLLLTAGAAPAIASATATWRR